MENRSHALIAGLFTLLLAAALIAAALWLKGDTAAQTAYVVASRHSVAGLTPQATVKLRGVNVGKVTGVRFDARDPGLILIDVNVDSTAPITEGTSANLGYQGVTGIAYIQLDDAGERPTPLPPGARIEMKPSALDQFSQQGRDVLEGAAQAAQRLSELLSPDNQEQLRRTLAGLETAAGRFVTLADGTRADIGRSLRSADRAFAGVASLTDELRSRGGPLLDRLDRLALRLDTELERFAAAADSAARLAESGAAAGDTLARQTLPRLDAMAEDVARTARSLEALSNRLHEASGSLDRAAGRLAEHPEHLIYGAPQPPPGPGEPGFAAPARREP